MEKQGRSLNYFDLTMIVVGLVIGMGIFRTPVEVAKLSGTVDVFFLAWFLGGVIALAGALTYAEIGSRYPVVGAYYKIFSTCYHPSIAFSINCIILVSNAASVAAVALMGAEYIANVTFEAAQNTVAIRMWIAGICVVLFYGLNLLGLKTSTFVQNALVIFKIGLMLIIMSAVFFSSGETSPLVSAPTTQSWTDALYALGVCSVAVSFTYGGYQHSINFGTEVKDANRIMPKSIAMGIGIVLLLYMLINYAYISVIGFSELGKAESIGAIMVSKIFGQSGYQIVSWLFFFSVLGYVNVMLLTNPRVMYAMSEEGTMPAAFSAINKKTEVMTVALTVFTITVIFTLFFAKEFEKILDYIIFLDSIGMATSAATLFYFRSRNVVPEGKKIYKVPLYPLTPIFYILAYTLIAFSVFVKNPTAALYGVLIFIIFIAIYWIVYFINIKPKKR